MRVGSLLLLVVTAALPAQAGEVSVRVREDGVKVIVNEPSTARARRLAGNLLPVPDPDLAAEIERQAAARQLDTRLVQALVQVESGYNAMALSNKGAMGLMQLMPGTARELAVDDPWDPHQNLRGGTTYLRQLLDRFGELESALAAYNAGPEAVVKHGGIPPYAETRDYVRHVLHLFDGRDSALEGRKVFIMRDADSRIRLTTDGLGRP